MKTSFSTRTSVASCVLVGTCLMFGASAGARTPTPMPQMAVAEASLQHASTADTSADAPRELQVATSKLAAAREALARRDKARAQQLAEQAELDARVAELHAQRVRAERAAHETEDANRVLADEISRKTAR